MTPLGAEISRSLTDQWEPFGAHHVTALVIASVLCVNIVAYRREAARVRLDVWLVAALVAVHLAWVSTARTTGLADWGDLLPLYTCDASVILGLAWCRWKPRWLSQVLFLWAFLGGVVTLLLPDTFGYALPHIAPMYTLVFHALLLALAIEMWAVERVRPSWRGLAVTVAASAALIPPALWANATFGSDYMFVSRNPGGIFSWLTAFDGVPRILATIGAGSALLAVGTLAWWAMDRALEVREAREFAPPGPRHETAPALSADGSRTRSG